MLGSPGMRSAASSSVSVVIIVWYKSTSGLYKLNVMNIGYAVFFFFVIVTGF